jgi:hypothetical protein
LKIKLKGHHFDRIVMFEAQSQALLNTLTEHDFQDAFRNGRNARKGTTSRVMVASMPKVTFWPDGNTSPRNYIYEN